MYFYYTNINLLAIRLNFYLLKRALSKPAQHFSKSHLMHNLHLLIQKLRTRCGFSKELLKSIKIFRCSPYSAGFDFKLLKNLHAIVL